MPAPNTLEKILDQIVIEDNGCYVFSGPKDDGGYGRVGYKRRLVRVHRLLYEELVGPVPEGLELDRLCRNHACANPDHLEPVTHKENMARGLVAAVWEATRQKTHCKYGHAYDDGNRYSYFSSDGQRTYRGCRICRSRAMREYRQRQRTKGE